MGKMGVARTVLPGSASLKPQFLAILINTEMLASAEVIVLSRLGPGPQCGVQALGSCLYPEGAVSTWWVSLAEGFTQSEVSSRNFPSFSRV